MSDSIERMIEWSVRYSTIRRIEGEVHRLIDEYSEMKTWCEDVGHSRESSLYSVMLDDLNELLGYIEKEKMEGKYEQTGKNRMYED